MFFKLYFIALPIFLLIDFLWVGYIAKNFYAKQIGSLFKADINWIAAIIFYLIFITGLVVFVISPAIASNTWTHALIFGALFGLVTYATYDLTNLALAKDWPIFVTVVDLIWGTFLASFVSVLTYFIFNRFF